MKLKIGSVTLDNPIILAPMAGVSDMPFRLLCHEQGAGLVCTEMISAKAIYYQNKNTESLMAIHSDERPVSLQLGCPVPKVVNNGEGSALLRQPELVRKIVSAVVSAVDKPVTVKIRKGFNDESVNAVEIARIIEDCGAAAVVIHGRTREQYYSGKADWNSIRLVKEAVSIPVIGNGDVDSPEAARKLFEQTGCDGIMVGRAARGNPWLFQRILHYLHTGEIKEKPSIEEVKDMILRHARMQVEEKGAYTGIREMRKHVAWYTVGFPHSAELRRRVNELESLEELNDLLQRRLEEF